MLATLGGADPKAGARHGPVPRPPTALALAVALGAAAAARAQTVDTDWFASLYTPEGVELRADERLFALYALFNAMGHDEASVLRKDPVPKREYHPVRRQVRAAVAAIDEGLRAKVDAFFDAHPLPASAYLAYAARLAGPPRFAPPADAGDDLAGLDSLLAAAHERLRLSALFEQVQDEYRNALRIYLKSADAPLAGVRRLLKIKEDDEQQRTVLAVNLLDAAGRVDALSVNREQWVVLGPSSRPDLVPIAREFARLHVAPAVQKRVASYKVDALPAGRGTPVDYIIETAVRAAAMVAAAPPDTHDAELEAQAKGGYAGVREMVKVLGEFARTERPLEQYLSDTWPRVDAARKAR